MNKIHHKHIVWIKPLLLSCIMTGFISYINTLEHNNRDIIFWLKDWGKSWIFAYPVLLICLPLIEKFLARITR